MKFGHNRNTFLQTEFFEHPIPCNAGLTDRPPYIFCVSFNTETIPLLIINNLLLSDDLVLIAKKINYAQPIAESSS